MSFALSHAGTSRQMPLGAAAFAVCSQSVKRPFESKLSMAYDKLAAHGSSLAQKEPAVMDCGRFFNEGEIYCFQGICPWQ